MEKKDYENLMNYRVAMAMVEGMLSQGIITEEEFDKVEAKMCEKYCINISSIFRLCGSK